MELKYFSLEEEEFKNFNLSEILDDISEFGDGLLEFETPKIQSMAYKLLELEEENKKLKGIAQYYQDRDPDTGSFVFEDGTKIKVNKPGKFDVKLTQQKDGD